MSAAWDPRVGETTETTDLKVVEKGVGYTHVSLYKDDYELSSQHPCLTLSTYVPSPCLCNTVIVLSFIRPVC